MNQYRLNLRFDLNDPRERAAAEYIRNLDLTAYKSRNRFIVSAVCAYMDAPAEKEQGLLEGIREVIREELEGLQFSRQRNTALSTEEQTENDQSVLDDLEMFR